MSDNRTNIMAQWKEFNLSASKSIKEDFQSTEYEHQRQIAKYFKEGSITLVSSSSGFDIVTGERILSTYCIMTDGEYSWANTLSYYVEFYNLRLPKAFEDKIVEIKNF